MLLLASSLLPLTMGDNDGFMMIENHENVANGYFASTVRSTGLENEDDPSANTYCIIGALNSADYLFDDGYYSLKLIYRYSDGTNDTLLWTQTSWITEGNITGANLTLIDDDKSNGYAFYGLGVSSNSNAYLDGTGSQHSFWYHAVASMSCTYLFTSALHGSHFVHSIPLFRSHSNLFVLRSFGTAISAWGGGMYVLLSLYCMTCLTYLLCSAFSV